MLLELKFKRILFWSKVRNSCKVMTKTFEYTVVGRGPFPTDMLRYDAAWPADTGHGILEPRLEREVRLRSGREPTIDRWRSFGWTIKDLRSYR